MKNIIPFAIMSLLIITGSSALAVIPFGKEYISPDGKYSFSLQEVNDNDNDGGVIDYIKIKNRNNNTIIASFEQEARISKIEWGKLSNNIFVINEMSGASDLIIISLRGGKWKSQEYYPKHSNPDKGEFAKCYLYNYTVHKNIMKAYFAYTFENNWTKDGNMDVSGMDTMEINLTNGKIEKTTNRKISYDKYDHLIH